MQTIEDITKEVTDMKVFDIATHINVMIVSTTKTVSKVNYKRLMKMNGNVYLKVINFKTALTVENLEVLKDISLKTNKFSQESLNESKTARLQGKFKEKARDRSISTSMAYDHFIDVIGYEPSREQLAAHMKDLNK